jgi:alpha-L-arabinofuranosidase
MGIMWGAGNSKPMPVTLRLESKSGEILAQTNAVIQGRQWTRQSFSLTPTKTVADARFVLLANDVGGICLDMISLFPQKTFHNRTNGLRADLAQAVADLKPKFMRFPGGCLVHGQGVYQYYDWKDSVGPLEQRRNGRNLWNYDQTRGLGYFEFFQFCEDIGAKPLPVVSAGVCCQHAGSSPGRGQEGLPMEEMPAYIQDVLDLIEWANGPATSKWGSVRAAAGHPEPFGLKFLGVGNEDAITPIFKERFKMIYDALKSKHPEITVVGTAGPMPSGADFTNGWAFAKTLGVPMIDEHYYVSPEWFWNNLSRYDKYDRKGPKVYVGEYAAHDREKSRNTLRGAIAEAAGLTGFERNADVVQFASYAPLFSRRNHTQWTPDMIYFTGTDILLSANYYVQQLFGQNSGDETLATTVETPAKQKLAVSSVRDSKSGDTIIKIVNGAGAPADLKVELAGVPAVELNATKIVLTGATPDTINEEGKETAVKPVSTQVKIKTAFDYQAPACSLTVFRFKM